MSHTERVKIVEGGRDLVRQLLGTSLSYLEVALLEVREQVTARQILHDNINVVLVLEDIEEADDVGVLTHLENLDLSSLQLDILQRHFLL